MAIIVTDFVLEIVGTSICMHFCSRYSTNLIQNVVIALWIFMQIYIMMDNGWKNRIYLEI